MLRFDKATYLLLLLKYIFSTILSNSLWGSDVLLFLEFKLFISNLLSLTSSSIFFKFKSSKESLSPLDFNYLFTMFFKCFYLLLVLVFHHFCLFSKSFFSWRIGKRSLFYFMSLIRRHYFFTCKRFIFINFSRGCCWYFCCFFIVIIMF